MKTEAGFECRARLAGLLLLLLPSVGCIKNSVVARVNKDGTGHILVSTFFSKQAVDLFNLQMHGYRSARHRSQGDAVEKEVDPFFNENALKGQAKRFGPGVRFVKARRFDSGGARGSVALYSFQDVNEVFIDLEHMGELFHRSVYRMEMGDEGDDGEPVRKSEKAYEFKLAKGPSAKLQILVPSLNEESGMSTDADEGEEEEAEPDKKKDKAGDEDDDADDATFEDSWGTPMQMMQMAELGSPALASAFVGMRERDAAEHMLKGMQVNVAVQVDGAVVSTTSKLQDPANKNRIRLIDLDMDQILASPKGKKMAGRGSLYRFAEPRGMMPLLNQVPGAVMETNREVVVEFK